MPEPDPTELVSDFLACVDAALRPLAPVFAVLEQIARLAPPSPPAADG